MLPTTFESLTTCITTLATHDKTQAIHYYFALGSGHNEEIADAIILDNNHNRRSISVVDYLALSSQINNKMLTKIFDGLDYVGDVHKSYSVQTLAVLTEIVDYEVFGDDLVKRFLEYYVGAFSSIRSPYANVRFIRNLAINSPHILYSDLFMSFYSLLDKLVGDLSDTIGEKHCHFLLSTAYPIKKLNDFPDIIPYQFMFDKRLSKTTTKKIKCIFCSDRAIIDMETDLIDWLSFDVLYELDENGAYSISNVSHSVAHVLLARCGHEAAMKYLRYRFKFSQCGSQLPSKSIMKNLSLYKMALSDAEFTRLLVVYFLKDFDCRTIAKFLSGTDMSMMLNDLSVEMTPHQMTPSDVVFMMKTYSGIFDLSILNEYISAIIVRNKIEAAYDMRNKNINLALIKATIGE